MGSPGIINNRMPVLLSSFLGIDVWITAITERSFDSQATCVIDGFGLFSWYLGMGVYTTRHWQTSGRLVQKLNVCTVVQKKFCGHSRACVHSRYEWVNQYLRWRKEWICSERPITIWTIVKCWTHAFLSSKLSY